MHRPFRATGATPSFLAPRRMDTLSVASGRDRTEGTRRKHAEERVTGGTVRQTGYVDTARAPAAEAAGDEGRHAHRDGIEPPPAAPPSPPRTHDTAHRAPADDAVAHARAPGLVERAAAFALAVLLDAASQTLEWLGLTRPQRLPFSLACFGLLFFLLGLPPDWMDAPFGGRVMELGAWDTGTAGRAFMVQLAATFAMRLVLARPRVRAARDDAPSQTRRRLIEQGDELLAQPVTSAQELQAWVERHDAWLRRATLELAESHSAAAADRVRSASTDEPVHFRHAFSAVHDGWLNLLARRIEYIGTLTDRDAGRSSPSR
jgi:hypothetical protein